MPSIPLFLSMMLLFTASSHATAQQYDYPGSYAGRFDGVDGDAIPQRKAMPTSSNSSRPGKIEDLKITTGTGMVQIKDGAILVVSAADGPMPAPALEPKIRSALQAKNIAYTAANLRSLAEQVARRLPSMRTNGQARICAVQGQPCVTVVRK